ncbi:MAG TPA: phosphatidate cytidylyltransferase [Rectinemataceae bacterium]|nr:phosphatidate cytidylyltransferase [Rectinemataceae bacterium]
MTKNTIQRLLVFFLGIPLFLAVVNYASFGRNILLAVAVAVIQFLCVREASALFAAKNMKVNRLFLTILSAMSTLIVYLSPALAGLFPGDISPLEILFSISVLGSLAVMAPFSFAKAEEFSAILPNLAASLFVFFYCGVLGSFLVYITSCFGQYLAPVLTFTFMTFGNDSLAWLVGVTLGRKRGIVAVSPGKSVAGFIGGFCGSILAALIAFSLFPESGFGPLARPLFLGVVMGCSVILGDLVESALKRSAGVKDSSSLVPGRGGVLDSFDSLLFSAPLFVLISALLGFFPPLA